MKIVKKTVAVLLAVITVFGTFAACGKPVEAMYVNAGTFYQYFVNMEGIVFEHYSNDDDLLSEEEAEKIIYDLGYIDDNQLGKCAKSITKDWVAQICVRSSRFRKTGDIQIKDAKKCCDSQAAVDSVAMEIFSLKNNYFEAKKKMSVDDCKAAVENLQKYEANTHFEERNLEIIYKDNAVVLTDLVDYELSVEPDEPNKSLASFEKPNTSFMDLKGDSKYEIDEMETPSICGGLYTFKFYNYDYLSYPQLTFLKEDNILVVPDAKGDYSQFDDASATGNGSLITPLAIKVTKNEVNGMFRVVSGYKVEPEEYIDYDKTVKANPYPSSLPLSKLAQVVKTNTSLGGEFFKGIKVNVKDGALTVSYNNKFTVPGDKDKLQVATPSMNFTAKFYNFKIDHEHLWKICYKKNEDAYLRLTYDSDIHAKVTTGSLRFSPDNNRNCGLKYEPGKGFSGDAFSALKRSRVTAGNGKGSEAIKIAQASFPVPYTPIIIKVNVYLSIQLDGSIEISLEKTNGFEIDLKKSNWKITPSFNKISINKKAPTAELKANIDLSFNACPEIDLFAVNIVDATVAVGIRINALAAIYDKSSNDFSEWNELSNEDMDTIVKGEENKKHSFNYCVGLKASIYIKLTVFDTPARTECCVRKILDVFSVKDLSIEFIIWTKSTHIEDGHTVSACSRDAEEEEKTDVQIDSTNGIVLTSYKETVNPEESVAVKLVSLPKISGPGLSPMILKHILSVKSKDEKIAKAVYDENSEYITITGVSTGSTEIEIIVPDVTKLEKISLLFDFLDKVNAGDDEYTYKNSISVTVSNSGTTGVSFNGNSNSLILNQLIQYC